MDKTKYAECYETSDDDNKVLAFIDSFLQSDMASQHMIRRYEEIGEKYTKTDGWYYEFDENEHRYYVVVDKE